MFLSKIYFFLLAAVTIVAVALALMLPRPAERQRFAEEERRVVTACDVVNILLHTNARSRVDLAGTFARSEIDVASVLAPATSSGSISPEANKTARAVANQLIASTTGDKPDFVMLIDGRGRAVARVGVHDNRYGDKVAGYYLVDDALNGFLRDDLWLIDGQLFLVAASPVIGNRWAGALVVGHQVDKELVERLVSQLGVQLAIYAGQQPVAISTAVALHDEVLEQHGQSLAEDRPIVEDCRGNSPFVVDVGGALYTVLNARLPGEAGVEGALFAVFTEQPKALGIMGMLRSLTRDDIGFGQFPWITLALILIAIMVAGIGLLIWENDRPVRRLERDALKFAQGASDRLSEDQHGGHFAAIARSVNIGLDKVKRTSRASGRASTQDGAAPTPVPSSAVTPSPAKQHRPPPSEFKFTDQKPMASRRAGSVSGVGGSSPGMPPPKLPGAPPVSGSGKRRSSSNISKLNPARMDSAVTAIDDIFSNSSAPVSESVEIAPVSDESFRMMYDEFLALKHQCGESIVTLTYEKFARKLRKSRAALRAKHHCDEVKFQVYIKDGKAAIKAKPVMPE